MSGVQVTQAEQGMLRTLHAKADELCRLWQEALTAGFSINMNLNPHIGACDRFDVHKMVPVDLRSAAN